ncbi:MAG: DNA translocase FtsK, partial [Minisyncoccia bacterium]
MKRRKNKKDNNRLRNKNEAKNSYPILTSRLKRWMATILFVFLSLLVFLSIFGQAGRAGDFLYFILNKIFGNVVYFLPLFLILAGFLFLNYQRKRIFTPIIIGFLLIIVGLCGIFTLGGLEKKLGGWLGYFAAFPIINFFGSTVTKILFLTLILTGGIIIWEFTPKPLVLKEEKNTQITNLKDQKIKQQLQTLIPKKKVEIHPISFLTTKKELLIKQANENIQKNIEEEYKIPPASLFDLTQEKPQSFDIQNKSFIIQKTLENFGIPVEMKDVNVGPTVTQYTLKPAEGIKLSKIVSLANDLALSLAAHSVRIEAPIPGKSLVGIEIPNNQRAKIKLGFLLLKDEFLKSKNKLEFVLGTDVVGNPIFLNIEDMPHLLVAGSTGSGKTICLNSIIMSLIYRNSPRDLRLVLIDPKRVEFVIYNNLPHLLTPVILDAKSALLCLSWLVQEMERRFEVLQEANCRDIIIYNKKIKETPKMQKEGFEKMPYIVVVIDELADLMAAKGKEIEGIIVRLAQLARAVGIHLILATQRPSVEVITGLIKANITSRIAFQVASQIDSRTILDTAGAEKLLGKGDLLFQTSQFAKPKRAQGAFISVDEIRKIVNFIQ